MYDKTREFKMYKTQIYMIPKFMMLNCIKYKCMNTNMCHGTALFNLCVPVVLLRPYGLSYTRPCCGYNVRDRHRHSCMQMTVAGAVM